MAGKRLTLTEVMGRLHKVYEKEGRGAFYGLALAMHPKTIKAVFGGYDVEELNTESFHLPIVGDRTMQRDEMKVVEYGDDVCRVRPIEEPRPRQGP
jgi:hypothetical protein